MKRFAYKAIDTLGKTVEGEVDAVNEKDLESYFMKGNLTPLKVGEKKEGGESFLYIVKARMARKLFESELIAFTRQFAAAYGAGIPVGRSLDLLASQTKHELFKEALEAISKKVQDGMGLTETFSKYPRFFDKTYTSILHSGEISGNLDDVLNYSANLLEKKLLHKERIRSTFLYPKLVVGMIGITMTVVILFVIPQFAKLYDKFEAPLPLPTLMMVSLSNFIVAYWWIGVMMVPAVLYLISWLKQHVGFMLWLHERIVFMPMLGSTFLKIELTHFCTTFALLMRSGIKITDSASISIDSLKNTFMRKQLTSLIPVIEQGGTLADGLAKVTCVPPLMSSMIAIGEETGTLETLLDRVSALYDHETDLMLKKLPTLIEPIVLGFLFCLVFMLALAVYLPMWKMATLLRH